MAGNYRVGPVSVHRPCVEPSPLQRASRVREILHRRSFHWRRVSAQQQHLRPVFQRPSRCRSRDQRAATSRPVLCKSRCLVRRLGGGNRRGCHSRLRRHSFASFQSCLGTHWWFLFPAPRLLWSRPRASVCRFLSCFLVAHLQRMAVRTPLLVRRQPSQLPCRLRLGQLLSPLHHCTRPLLRTVIICNILSGTHVRGGEPSRQDINAAACRREQHHRPSLAVRTRRALPAVE
jgi:hypothetical protein